MFKVSELLGKPLLSLCDAEFLGTIVNICFDDKMIRGTFLTLLDGDDEYSFLPMSKLVNIENDAAVVKDSEGISNNAEGLNNPINGFAFNQNGKALGKIKDVIMDGVKVISFVTDEGELPICKLISAGKLLIFNDGAKPFKLTQRRVKKEKQKSVDLPVKTAFAPSYDFLLGKKLQRTIAASDGKIIAREGENVTGDIIEDAKREGKLVILALNSL